MPGSRCARRAPVMLLPFLFVILLTGCAILKKPVGDRETLHDPLKLKSDVDFAYNRLKKLHPRLYEYSSKQTLDHKFDSLKVSINAPMTAREFYFVLAPVIREVRQGHTVLTPPTRKLSFWETLLYSEGAGTPLYHYDIEVFDNRAYVVNNRSGDPAIRSGTEILTINGIPSADLLSRYKPGFAYDGWNKAFADWRANKQFTNLVYYEFEFCDRLTCSLKYQDSTWTDTLMKWEPSYPRENKDTTKSREGKILRGYNQENQAFSKTLEILDTTHSIALLRVLDFYGGDYTKYYGQSFHKIDSLNIRNLILDLRDNLGGKVVDAATLFSYFTDSTFRFLKGGEVSSRSSILHKNYFGGHPFLLQAAMAPGYPGQLFFSFLQFLACTKNENGRFQVPLKENRPYPPSKPTYDGNLFVLINGGTFSAAAILATAIRATTPATFVGTETGGASSGCVAYQFARVLLPESRLEFRIGLVNVKTVAKSGTFGQGIQPDIEIRPTLGDRLKGIDPELKWVLDKICK